MSAKQQCMDATPQWLHFKTKVSFILWAEFNLIFLVESLRGVLDLSALFAILAVTSLLVVKLKQFVDQTKTLPESEPEEYFSREEFGNWNRCLANCLNIAIHRLVSINSLESYLKYTGAVVVGSILLNMFSACCLVFLSVNTVFLLSFLKNFLNVDVCQMFDMYVQKAKDATNLVQLPKYKESKKNI